jgi:co-chaperonin GroES (HSP10)
MKPLANNILVETIELDEKTGTILLATKETSTRVVSVGEDVKLVKPGDIILTAKVFEAGGHLFTKEQDVIAIKGE